MYDVIIIGTGPAGLSAAVYGVRAGLKVLALEKNPMSGGQIVDTYEVDNYLGLPGMNGFDLAMKFREHADKLGAEIKDGSVTKIVPEGSGDSLLYNIETENGSFQTKTVILAMGAMHAHLGAPGETELSGKGVSYCATCDGAFFRGKTAVVVGGGDVAVEDAIFLARGCEHVYLVHRRDELRAAKILQDELLSLKNVTPVWDSVVKEIRGGDAVGSVLVENVKDGSTQEIAASACFIAVGILPQTALCEGLVDLDDKGYVLADENGATSRPGIFAAGDLRKKRLRQVITAVADGATAITAAGDYLTGART